MKWFKHDSDAHTDAKVKKLRHRFGIAGFGLYMYCIERIAATLDSKNISFVLEEDAETIAIEWRMDEGEVQRILDYMVELKLFGRNRAGQITCFKLAKRLDDTHSKNPEIRKILTALENVGEAQDISDLVGESPRSSEELRETPKDSESVGEAPNVSDQISLDQISLEQIKTHPENPDASDENPQVGTSEQQYAFEGESFRINQRDFKQHSEIYQNIDLIDHYRQLDIELRDTPKKQRWGALHAKLNYRNKNRPDRQPNAGSDPIDWDSSFVDESLIAEAERIRQRVGG